MKPPVRWVRSAVTTVIVTPKIAALNAFSRLPNINAKTEAALHKRCPVTESAPMRPTSAAAGRSSACRPIHGEMTATIAWGTRMMAATISVANSGHSRHCPATPGPIAALARKNNITQTAKIESRLSINSDFTPCQEIARRILLVHPSMQLSRLLAPTVRLISDTIAMPEGSARRTSETPRRRQIRSGDAHRCWPPAHCRWKRSAHCGRPARSNPPVRPAPG